MKELRTNTATKNVISLIEITPITPVLSTINQVLAANRNSPSLQALRRQALYETPGKLLIERDLLLFNGRLIVPDTDNLRTLIIREVHDQVFTAHSSAKKTL